MYRSRPVVLVIFAAAAACSTRDDAASVAGLAKDTTLARLSLNQQEAPALPAACGTAAVAASSPAANEPQAKELARQGYAAEVLGHVGEARSLLRRAFQLDGADESVAYHLGRTSEAVGDRAGAVAAYCRYLTLTSTATGAADARQRVARLTQSQANVVASNPALTTSPHRRAFTPTHVAARVRSRVTSRTVATTGTVPTRDAQSERSAAGMAGDPADSDGRDHRSASDGDVVVATSTTMPSSAPASTVPGARQRGITRTQGAGVGAVAGAIIGAAAGRSVRSAVIGAAAGGIIGTVVAGGSR